MPYTIAHLSDVHIPPLPPLSPGDWFSKRALGLFSWHRKWKAEHRVHILVALQRSLDALAPDHICITGDLTFTTHPGEVAQATRWLQSLGSTESISLVPGNHDAYVPGALEQACEAWAPWMTGDGGGQQQFPYLHRRGGVDIIGLSSGIPLRLPMTVGRIGSVQLEALRSLLAGLEGSDRPCVVLIHHPPQEGAARHGKELLDREALRSVLGDYAVDLVLHGHLHRPVRATLQGQRGTIEVLGASSASALGDRYAPAHYHLLEFDRDGGQTTIALRHVRYDRASDTFVPGEREVLTCATEPH
ncbi:MAG: metallophosphoesterase [Gammaproteobacteria bacterium]|nr:metallophosphoesterase [Gammaproteobacteria bacterium]